MMRCRPGTVSIRGGPGSAVHRCARASRCTASGTRVDRSLPLDARGLDDARPFVEVLADELAELIGGERKRRHLLLGELLDHLRVAHDGERLLREALYDLLRRACRRDDAD